MPSFFLADIEVLDPKQYQEYVDRASKALFVYAPDTSIKVHPVKFGSDEYTSVIGVMTGTFTKPMPTGDGLSSPRARGSPYPCVPWVVGRTALWLKNGCSGTMRRT
jgi:hypothetical protein